MSKRRKRLIFIAAPVAALLALAVVVKVKVDRLEAGARQLAQSGQAAQKVLGEYKSGVEKFDAGRVAAVYDDSYANEAEGDWAEELQSERDGVRVYEWEQTGVRPFGKREVGEQVARYLRGLGQIEESKFKLDSVERIDDAKHFVIRSFLWLRGTRPARGGGVAAVAGAEPAQGGGPDAGAEAFETQVLFRMRLCERGGGWKITRQELIHGTTVTGDRRGFTDITADAGIAFAARQNPMWSTPEWRPAKTEFVKYGSGGVAAADYDADGWYDIFFADGERPRLYRNRGGGRFEDATASAGLPEVMPGAHVGVFADFDNDGHKDLFVGFTTDRNRLFRNRGDGRFEDVTEGAGLGGHLVTVAAVADYDNDGDLDIYAGRYLDPRKDVPTTLFYARNGAGNSLLRNDGRLRFTDVTEQAGVREGGLALGVAWGDYDGDGRQDIYATNDFGRNALLRNRGDGTFADVSYETGTLDFGYGMSSTFADVDNDGDLDIYVSNVHSGQRWYAQAVTLHKYMLNSLRQGTFFEDFPTYREIYAFVGADYRGYGDRMVKGNSLLINDGAGRFRDVAESARANPFGWYWSSTVFDYDNDGRQDIYAVNGWITSKTTADL
ncbi:MAG TPA: VCBS repeat-containing protein [Pyrinomonadaceae bacterium]|nr:VCBS repeat-containing protein [Pyrinomonadaceae bacterium]